MAQPTQERRKKIKTSVSLSPEAVEFLKEVYATYRISASTFIELLIRNFGQVMVDRLGTKKRKP